MYDSFTHLQGIKSAILSSVDYKSLDFKTHPIGAFLCDNRGRDYHSSSLLRKREALEAIVDSFNVKTVGNLIAMFPTLDYTSAMKKAVEYQASFKDWH